MNDPGTWPILQEECSRQQPATGPGWLDWTAADHGRSERLGPDF